MWSAIASFAIWVLQKIFPQPQVVDPAADAQIQKDRADGLQEKIDDIQNADKTRDSAAADILSHGVREHDRFEREGSEE